MADTARNIRLAIEVIRPFLLKGDEATSRERLDKLMLTDDGAWQIVDGLMGLSMMLLQDFEFEVDPPIDPKTKLKKIERYTIEHPEGD